MQDEGIVYMWQCFELNLGDHRLLDHALFLSICEQKLLQISMGKGGEELHG